MAAEHVPAVGSAHPSGDAVKTSVGGGGDNRGTPSIDWEWIYAETVDPGVEPHPGVTSVFNDTDPDPAFSDSGAA